MSSEIRKGLLLYVSIEHEVGSWSQRLLVVLPQKLKLLFVLFVNFNQECPLRIHPDMPLRKFRFIYVFEVLTYKICFMQIEKLPYICFPSFLDAKIDILQMKNSDHVPATQLTPEVDPRLIIQKEIETYRSKMSEYQLLEKELNQLDLHLEAKEAPQNDVGKLSRVKSDRGKASDNMAKRNINKKIKIYELQKKYDRAAREKEQKRTIFDKNMEKNNKITWQIEELSRKIQSQKNTTQNLKQLELQIEGDLQVTSSKIQDQVKNLQISVKQKQVCNYERKKLRDCIKRTRMVIHNISNNLTEELQLSYSDEEERHFLKSDNSLLLVETSPHATDLQICMEKQTKRIEDYFAKYESNHQRNETYLSDFYTAKKEMISNQLLVKHHKVTIALQSAKIKEYDKLIHKYRQNIAKGTQISNQITLKINNLDGQRGYMRGSIGVKIQQQRLVKAVNALLEEDIKKVREKLAYLIFLKTLVQKKTL